MEAVRRKCYFATWSEQSNTKLLLMLVAYLMIIIFTAFASSFYENQANSGN